MNNKFEVLFLEDVIDFFDEIEEKARLKILYNIRKAQVINDPKLFKKLTGTIWEFRTKYENLHYRLFAFWDKTDGNETLVITTHGIIKKTDKVPKGDIEKADALRAKYLNEKKKL